MKVTCILLTEYRPNKSNLTKVRKTSHRIPKQIKIINGTQHRKGFIFTLFSILALFGDSNWYENDNEH